MNKKAPNPPVVVQLTEMFEGMDKIITYESDVCGDDKSTLEKYMEISKLVYEVLEKKD